MEEVDNIIGKYGLRAAIIIFAIYGLIMFIKYIVEKTVNNYFDTNHQRQITQYENEIQRKTMSYKILVEKELEFYDNYFKYASSLVTDIQDVVYNYERDNDKKLHKYVLNILETIPKLKKETLLYESYCEHKVGHAIVDLLSILQYELGPAIELMISRDIETEKVKELSDKILKQLAIISSLIYKREQEMSN